MFTVDGVSATLRFIVAYASVCFALPTLFAKPQRVSFRSTDCALVAGLAMLLALAEICIPCLKDRMASCLFIYLRTWQPG